MGIKIDFPTVRPPQSPEVRKVTGSEVIDTAQQFGEGQLSIINPQEFFKTNGITDSYKVTPSQMQLGNIALLKTPNTVGYVHNTVRLLQHKQQEAVRKPEQTRFKTALLLGAESLRDHYSDYAKRNQLEDKKRGLPKQPGDHPSLRLV